MLLDLLRTSPLEAHHGREANTVIRNLTKKRSLQNLNWNRVLKEKSVCLNSSGPQANTFPQPMATDWEECSNIDYDVNHMNHPKKLAQDQLVSVDNQTPPALGGSKHSRGVKLRETNAQTSRSPSKRTELLFQRIKDTGKRYKPVKQNVVSESQHTLTLANGSVLRKSGVAGKALGPNAPKFWETATPNPPTMGAVKRRADLKRAQEEQATGISARKMMEAGTRSKWQNWDYEDEANSDSEYERLRISRYAGKSEDNPTAGPNQGDALNAPSEKYNTECCGNIRRKRGTSIQRSHK